MNQKFVRIVAIVLAVAIVGSVFIAALTSVVAMDASGAVITPATGDEAPVIPIVIGVVAALLVVACVLIPKFSKK